MNDQQYVSFSEQAYGIAIVEYCKSHKSVCLTAGDEVAFGSTEGGEVPLLYFLMRDTAREGKATTIIFPDAVCPYTNASSELNCPGYTAENIARNPVSFDILSHESYYDIKSIKAALNLKQHAMGLSVGMHKVFYYQPCSIVGTVEFPSCDGKAVDCPPKFNFHTNTCLKIQGNMYNMDGEFFSHNEMVLEGGHAMTLVGYNDDFVTQAGMQGGFILRNSWQDGMTQAGGARGSHSLMWWMQNISDTDERVICPNSYNPLNWFVCEASSCTSNQTREMARAAIQPLRIKCVDTTGTICTVDDNTVYFVVNYTTVGDSSIVMCFLKATISNGSETPSGSVCTNAPWGLAAMDKITAYFQPPASEIYGPNEDKHDLCGFYFFPYQLLEASMAKFRGFFVTNFDLSFSNSSFIKGSDSNLDYSMITASTLTQDTAAFPEPYPNYV